MKNFICIQEATAATAKAGFCHWTYIVLQGFVVAGLDEEVVVDTWMLKVMADGCNRQRPFSFSAKIRSCRQGYDDVYMLGKFPMVHACSHGSLLDAGCSQRG